MVLAAVLVPWQPVPGGMPAPVPAGDVLTPEQLARAEDYAGTTRLIAWAVAGRVVGGLLPPRLHLARHPPAGAPEAALAGHGHRSRHRGPPDRPAGHAAVRVGAAAPARRLRPEHAERRRLVAGPGPRARGGGDRHLDRPAGAGRVRASLADVVAGDRRGRLRGPGAAGVVRLPAPGRAALQRLHLDAGRASCGPRSCASPTRRGSRSTTCWSPTRPAVRRRSTPTSPASGAPVASWSTTTWSTTSPRTRCSRWWPTSSPTRSTTTCWWGRCWGRSAWWPGSACWPA